MTRNTAPESTDAPARGPDSEPSTSRFRGSVLKRQCGQLRPLASRIEQDLAQGQVKNLPWPSLSSRNIVENRFGDG